MIPKKYKCVFVILVLIIVYLSFGIYSLKKEIALDIESNEKLVASYVNAHQVIWGDESLKMDDMDAVDLARLIDSLEESTLYYKTASFLYQPPDNKAFGNSTTQFLYGQYCDALRSYRDRILNGDDKALEELKKTELLQDVKYIGEWFYERHKNKNTKLYGDTEFKNEVLGGLKTETMKAFFH